MKIMSPMLLMLKARGVPIVAPDPVSSPISVLLTPSYPMSDEPQNSRAYT